MSLLRSNYLSHVCLLQFAVSYSFISSYKYKTRVPFEIVLVYENRVCENPRAGCLSVEVSG